MGERKPTNLWKKEDVLGVWNSLEVEDENNP
jgi:hypothetical protein